MEVLPAVFHLTLIVAFAYYLRRKYSWNEWFYWPALVLKLTAGICLGLLYEYYFEVGDTFVYFRDGAKLASLARNDFSSYLQILFLDLGLESSGLVLMEPRALFFTKVTSVLSIITSDNYWAISLYYSLVSFLGAWSLVRVMGSCLPTASLAAVIAFLFLPSVVLWTSGVLKESVAMAALFFLTGVFLRIWFGSRVAWWDWVMTIVAIFVFWKLKYYYAGAFIPVVIAALFYKHVIAPRFRLSAASEAVAWLCLLIVPLVIVTLLHPNFNLDRILTVIVTNNQVYNDLSQSGEYVQFHELTATPISVLLNAPWALFSGLFRPLFWETSSLVQLAQTLENTLLLVLFLAALSRMMHDRSSPHRLLMLALIAFVVGTCIFITLSAPNFGTLSRYRVGYISFFAFLIMCNNPLIRYVERSSPRLSGVSGKS